MDVASTARWAAVTAALNAHAENGFICAWRPGSVVTQDGTTVPIRTLEEAESAVESLGIAALLNETLGWRPCE